jgi:hypothetical protein
MDSIQIVNPYKIENLSQIDKNQDNSQIINRIKLVVNNFFNEKVGWSFKKNKKIKFKLEKLYLKSFFHHLLHLHQDYPKL